MVNQPPRRSVRDLLVPPAPRDATALPVPSGPLPPVEDPRLFVKLYGPAPDAARVVDAGPGYTVMEDQYGHQFRTEGKRPWRNNNPGNIMMTGRDDDVSMKHGAIGKDKGGFSVFPTQEAGMAAMRELLFSPDRPYANRNIDAIVEKYAPKAHGNDVEKYKRLLYSRVKTNEPIKRMNPAQREALIDAMLQMEGYYEGGNISIGDKRWARKPERVIKR